MWCRHREFKHGERRLSCHSLMNVAASSFWPVPSHRTVQIPLTCHQQLCILTLGDNHRFGSISEIELRPDNKTTLFSVISVIRFYLRTSTGQQLGKNCHRKIKMRGSIWFDFD